MAAEVWPNSADGHPKHAESCYVCDHLDLQAFLARRPDVKVEEHDEWYAQNVATDAIERYRELTERFGYKPDEATTVAVEEA